VTEEVKNEQTAVAENTNEEPKQESLAEGGAAQEDDGLEELLKEFDERRASATKQEQFRTTSEPSGDESKIDVAALAALERRIAEQEARDRQRELDNLYNRLADGLEATPLRVEGFLNALARRNPQLNDIWNNRMVNPREWERAEAAIRKEMLKEFGKKVDKQATESREAVASAVRSASTAAPPKELSQQDIVNMSKDDFDKLQRELGVSPV